MPQRSRSFHGPGTFANTTAHLYDRRNRLEGAMNVISTASKAVRRGYDISDAERELRVQAAAAFRIAHHYGWNRQINNHITVRLPVQPDRFLMNAYGLGWDEITASNLVTVDLAGNVLSHADVTLAPAGLNFHSGILRERPQLNCVIHVHATPGVVISATKGGLIIVDQAGCHIYGEVGTHDFEGFAEEADEVPRILRDLGDKHALIMWNHGLLAVGRTLGEAFLYMRRLVDACELQERLMATGAEIRRIPQEVLEHTRGQIADKRKKPAYSDAEWQYHLRLAYRLDPSFAE
jgi:ribulose-5-phosphate 4-epimerase/fuculose-1-phosphate aldolase